MTRKIRIFLQDITFPNAKTVRKNTLTVLGMSAVMAAYVCLVSGAGADRLKETDL